MIILNSSGQKLQAYRAGAMSVDDADISITYRDYRADTTSGDTGAGYGTQLSETAGTSTVDILAVPRTGTVREVVQISVVNLDDVSITLSIVFDNSGTDTIIYRVTLATQEVAFYQANGLGWQCYTAAGGIK